MAKTHPLFHKLKSVVGYSVAAVVIIIALGISGLRFILTTANVYQSEVEQLASSILEQPVKIGRMDAKLSGLIPTLIFHNVNIVSEKTNKSLFSLSRIDVGLSVKDLIWNQKITPAQLTVRGMNLHVTRTVEGSFKVKGFDLDALSKKEENESNTLIERLLVQHGEVGLEDSTFTWKDEKNAGLTWFFEDVSFLLKSTNERYQLLLNSKLPSTLGDKITLSFDLIGSLTLPETWDVKAFVKSKRFNLQPVQKYIKNKNFNIVNGTVDLALWLDWKDKNIKQLSGDVNLYDFSYKSFKNKVVTINNISGIFDAHQEENNKWEVGVDKFNYENEKSLSNSKFSLAFGYKDDVVDSFYLRADKLNLKSISKIVVDNNFVNRNKKSYINDLNVHGDLSDLAVSWQDNELYKLKAKFSGFGINSRKNIPKIESVSGTVIYEQHEGLISLSSENSIIGFPNLFRDEFKLDTLSADVKLSNTKAGILFDIKYLQTVSTEVKSVSSARLWLPKNDASPYLDLQTHVSEGDVSKVSHYLPVSIMDESLVNWLDKALVNGKVEKSTVLYNGNLNDFPFDKNEGVFSVAVDIEGLNLHYQDDWPNITNSKTAALFTGQGMNIHLHNGESNKNQLQESYATIKSFSEAELELELSAKGTTHNSLNFIVNSPLLPKAKKTIESMRLLGNIDARIKVNIPLDDIVRKRKSLSYSGTADLKNISLFMLEDKIDITEGNGRIFFSDNDVSSKNLVAKILNEKSAFTISSSSKNKKIKIAAKGEMKPEEILTRFNIPGAKKISGITPFQASITFPEKSTKTIHPIFKLDSNLIGVKSTLPEQFYKKSTSTQKFSLVTIFPGNNKTHLGVEFDKKGSAIFELAESMGKNYLSKGAVSASNKKAVLPRKKVLYVDGAINKFTPSKWDKALDLGKIKNTSTFFNIPIIFNLDKLKIISPDKGGADKDKAFTTTNPKKLPAFEGIIKQLYLDKIFLGRLDFKVSQKNYGLHFDEVILSAKNMKAVSNGSWRYARKKHKTDVNITLSSNDFGGMLKDLGFSVIIEKGTAKTLSKLSWPGAPTEFSLNTVQGKIQLNLEDGNIVEADAGAGRLLGFFSLSALPRKLFGDFSDTFKSGFNFDTANGEIKIDGGDAYLDEFLIASPVAEISVNGRTGLIAEDYENIIEVVPEVGGGLAGATALLVNLPAGIGLWLIDKLTGEKINKASTRIYEISGSWKKPIIEQIEEEEL